MANSFDISQLKLSQAAMDIRFDNAYMLWDRCGLIFTELSNKWANLKMKEVSPNATKFILDDRFDLAVILNKAHCIDLKPSSDLTQFIEISEVYLNTITEYLNLTKFLRLGFRLIYMKEFQDKNSASEYLISTNRMAIPKGKYFNIEGKVLLPRYSLLWEGESTAVRVILEVRSQKIDLDIDFEVEEIKPVHLEKHQFVYDIDYFTLQPTLKGQLNIKEWISQAHHVIKRDSSAFFGG